MEVGKNIILKMNSVGKKFPGVQALNDISFEIYAGEVHVIVGENGAGKSTLIQILSGAYQADEGEIFFNNIPLGKHSPSNAMKLGIFTVYQLTTMVPQMSIAENIFLGKEEVNNFGIVNQKKQVDLTQKYLEEFSYDINPKIDIEKLTVGEQKIIEICKAIKQDVKVLILDEPTAPLTTKDREVLFEIVRYIKSKGGTVIYISHRLEEVKMIGDRVTVLRDGQHVITKAVEDLESTDELIYYMTGKGINLKFCRVKNKIGEKVLQINQLSKLGSFKNVSFDLYSGEIVGVFGLVGCGIDELGKAIFGASSYDSGEIELFKDKSKSTIIKNNPKNSMAIGLNYLPPDKKKDGLVLNLSVKQNTTLPSLRFFSKFGIINESKETNKVNELISLINIVTPTINSIVQFLSGGNQQKVLLARALSCNPNIFIMVSPTVGIDVGAKKEIYNHMNMLTNEGSSIIMITYDLSELLSMSDRIIVFHEGKITGYFQNDKNNPETLEEQILKNAFGIV